MRDTVIFLLLRVRGASVPRFVTKKKRDRFFRKRGNNAGLLKYHESIFLVLTNRDCFPFVRDSP